jgi:hypothetical protein
MNTTNRAVVSGSQRRGCRGTAACTGHKKHCVARVAPASLNRPLAGTGRKDGGDAANRIDGTFGSINESWMRE